MRIQIVNLLHTIYLGLMFVWIMHFGFDIAYSVSWEICLTAWSIDVGLMLIAPYVKRHFLK